MLQGKFTRKVIASTLLTILATNILAPTVTYALSSGPTQPEATSFEPIDTTDMVNLQTGDFTYNIPLLEVPGPEGGYPLSLSYHAGIMPNEDASWVGLGWTINPGAINRNVNGYPDDWYNPSNASHVYWSGGVQSTWNVGVSIGVTGVASANFGLAFSQDTYMGFGLGMSAGVGLEIPGTPFGVGVGVGVSSYGEAYMTGGANMSQKLGENGLTSSIGINVTTNFESLNAGAFVDIGYKKKISGYDKPLQGSLLGTSISTGSNKPSLAIGGLTSSVSSTNTAKIKTSRSGWGAAVPIKPGVSITFGHSKTRYWTDEKTTTVTHGSMFSSGWPVNDNVAYDTYTLLEEPYAKNMVDYPDPYKHQGGTYMDYDLYSVNAQGLGGTIRPYSFQGEALGQNRKNASNQPVVTYYSPKANDLTPQFRFVGDFSNSYRQNFSDYSNANADLKTQAPPFDGAPVYGDNDGTYGFVNNKLAGSRHVNVGATILPSVTYGYQKNDRYRTNMIEGFSITNETGVTYHYALPAYSWGEEIYQEKINRSNGLSFNRQTKSEPYAYTWYLTSITGPDFVDRTGDSRAGDGDWGYWVNFEYGKWSNDYTWRTPGEGYNKDEDNEWQMCSMGKREVYYLNAIRTRSHVAFFEKDLRKDAKGANPDSYNTNMDGSTRTDYNTQGGYGAKSSQSMQLRKIYLLNAADGNFVRPDDGGSNPYSQEESTYSCSNCQLPQNVLDFSDIEIKGRSAMEAKAIRVIDFVYDYSLAPGTVNSFTPYSPLSRYGKLTLKALNLRGKQGQSLLPPTRFEYELTGDAIKTANSAVLTSAGFTTTNGSFEVGDLVTAQYWGFCGVITGKSGSGTYTYTLANNGFSGSSTTTTISTTKNPPYNKDAYDNWGMYKSDFNAGLAATNENLARKTTLASAKGTDAWCLRSITSPTGGIVNISYEADTYKTSVMNGMGSILMDRTSITSTQQPNNSTNLDFKINIPSGMSIADFFSVGDQFDTQFMLEQSTTPTFSSYSNRILQVKKDGLIISSGGNTLYSGWFSQDQYKSFTVTNINYTTNVITANTTVPYISELINTGSGNYFRYIGGNILNNNSRASSGGGVRVAEISVKDNTGQIASSTYEYNLPGKSMSSGVTSYEPSLLDVFDVGSNIFNQKDYKRMLYENSNNLIAISREIPPPGVTYEYVTVKNNVKNADESQKRTLDGVMQYKFEVYRENMIYRDVLSVNQGAYATVNQFLRNVVLRKFSAGIGNLKSVIQYKNNGQKISETINHYLHDGLEGLRPGAFCLAYKNRLSQFRHQGFIQERITEVKRIENSGTEDGIKATMSAKEEYPSIQTGQTKINYLNGTRVSSENLGFDFYSGAITKTVETDAYGNRFLVETVPAYRKYAAMGLKVGDNNRKNMLTQTTANYQYKVDGNNSKLGLVDAEVQTWSNQFAALDRIGNTYTQNGTGSYGDIWRMQSNYQWMPVNKTTDGMTPAGSDHSFNWTTPSSSNANWKKTVEINLYDVYSKGLQVSDINNNLSATHMSYESKRVELTGSNSNYFEMAFSGVEDDNVNQTNLTFVRKGDGVVVSDIAHTGKRSLRLGVSGKKGLLYTVETAALVSGRTYIASVWTKPVTGTSSNLKLYYEIDGVVKANSPVSTASANGWTLLTLTINGSDIVPGKSLTVGCRNDDGSIENYVDDLRFQPLTASTVAYVFDPFSGELTFVLDNNNQYTAFEYDGAGRLKNTYREKLGIGKIKTSEYEYNMKESLITFAPTIYAKMIYEFTNTTMTSCSKSHNYDVYVRFFSDPQCTIPQNVSNLQVRFTRSTTNSMISNPSPENYTVNIGTTPVNQHYVGNFKLIDNTYCSPNLNMAMTQFYLNIGDYIMKPTAPPAPPPIYAKLVKNFMYMNNVGCNREHIYNAKVDLYSNAACTIPVSTNFMGIRYLYNGNVTTLSIQGTPVSSVQLLLGFSTTAPLIIDNLCGGGTTEIPLNLVDNGNNYIIVP